MANSKIKKYFICGTELINCVHLAHGEKGGLFPGTFISQQCLMGLVEN